MTKFEPSDHAKLLSKLDKHSGNIYKKHNFIDGDVVLVKTAEEVNEWLKNK